MKEVWKDVVGFEKEYQVSNLGRVRSLDRMVWNGGAYWMQSGKMLTPRNSTPYSRVQIHKKDYYIHRLVADAFLPNPRKYPQINHKDENKRNNRADNLEWCTQAYNNRYGTKIARQVQKTRGIMINNKPVAKFTLNGCYIESYLSATMAGNINKIDNSSICKAAHGKIPSCGGFIWRWL